MAPIEAVLDQLKSEGFRLTSTRRKLVERILSLKGHWTIQSVAPKIKRGIPGLGVATVYRTIHLLAEKKFLTETKVGAGSARYEVSPIEHHDHLTCLDCHEIFEFENDQIEELQRVAAQKLGFRLADHRMELYGHCSRSNCPHLKDRSK